MATCHVPEQQAYEPAGSAPRLISAYCVTPKPSCFRLFEHCERRAASRAVCTAGNSRATKTPIIAITTSSSTKVKALFRLLVPDMATSGIGTDEPAETNSLRAPPSG